MRSKTAEIFRLRVKNYEFGQKVDAIIPSKINIESGKQRWAENLCRFSPLIAVMQAAKSWQGHNLVILSQSRLGCAVVWRILRILFQFRNGCDLCGNSPGTF